MDLLQTSEWPEDAFDDNIDDILFKDTLQALGSIDEGPHEKPIPKARAVPSKLAGKAMLKRSTARPGPGPLYNVTNRKVEAKPVRKQPRSTNTVFPVNPFENILKDQVLRREAVREPTSADDIWEKPIDSSANPPPPPPPPLPQWALDNYDPAMTMNNSFLQTILKSNPLAPAETHSPVSYSPPPPVSPVVSHHHHHDPVIHLVPTTPLYKAEPLGEEPAAASTSFPIPTSSPNLQEVAETTGRSETSSPPDLGGVYTGFADNVENNVIGSSGRESPLGEPLKPAALSPHTLPVGIRLQNAPVTEHEVRMEALEYSSCDGASIQDGQAQDASADKEPSEDLDQGMETETSDDFETLTDATQVRSQSATLEPEPLGSNAVAAVDENSKVPVQPDIQETPLEEIQPVMTTVQVGIMNPSEQLLSEEPLFEEFGEAATPKEEQPELELEADQSPVRSVPSPEPLKLPPLQTESACGGVEMVSLSKKEMPVTEEVEAPKNRCGSLSLSPSVESSIHAVTPPRAAPCQKSVTFAFPVGSKHGKCEHQAIKMPDCDAHLDMEKKHRTIGVGIAFIFFVILLVFLITEVNDDKGLHVKLVEYAEHELQRPSYKIRCNGADVESGQGKVGEKVPLHNKCGGLLEVAIEGRVIRVASDTMHVLYLSGEKFTNLVESKQWVHTITGESVHASPSDTALSFVYTSHLVKEYHDCSHYSTTVIIALVGGTAALSCFLYFLAITSLRKIGLSNKTLVSKTARS